MEWFKKKKNENTKKETDEPDLGRRRIIFGGAALAAAAIGSKTMFGKNVENLEQENGETDEIINIPQESSELENGDPLHFLNVPFNPVTIKSGDLEGRKFGYPLNIYFGTRGPAGPTMQIDFRKNLSDIWRIKLNKEKEFLGKNSLDMINASKKAMNEYGNTKNKKLGFLDKINDVKKVIDEIKNDIEIEKLVKYGGFGSRDGVKFRFFQTLVDMIKPESILIYSLTELMPMEGENCLLGINDYNFLLQNAGENFLDFIPALGDNYLSVGPHQFTQMAVDSVRKVQKNILLKNHVPEKVDDLRGNQNFKAAYLFAIFNLLSLIRNTNEFTLQLGLHYKQEFSTEDLEIFMATAHNRPVDAISAFQKYINHIIFTNKAKQKAIKKNPNALKNTKPIIKQNFLPFALEKNKYEVAKYAQKTFSNRKAYNKYVKIAG